MGYAWVQVRSNSAL